MRLRKEREYCYITKELINLFPDKTLLLSDFVTQVRLEMYNKEEPNIGRHKAYVRIGGDFNGPICNKVWGKKEDHQLVKLDGDDGWVYLGWIRKEEIDL